MPTNSNAYNSRITDEALEKRFRDTFRAQGGAELVDDLYAQGVIVPVVDFTQAAEGSQLGATYQQAWDFSTGSAVVVGATTTLVSTAGFWKVQYTLTADYSFTGQEASLRINDGSSTKTFWRVGDRGNPAETFSLIGNQDIIYLRSGDSLEAVASSQYEISVSWRQIATANGDLVNPTGFTSS